MYIMIYFIYTLEISYNWLVSYFKLVIWNAELCDIDGDVKSAEIHPP